MIEKNALVIGLGLSGLGAKNLLLQKGWNVRTIDKNGKADDITFVERGVPFDLAVLSPGISPSHPDVLAVKAKGIPIIGEAELGCRELKSKAIAVTGTNGKTTVSALIAHVLNQCGQRAQAIGNIGEPISEFVLDPAHDKKIAVIELSSYQLETLETPCFDAGVILNITPDHLDRYESMELYAQAKLRLTKLIAGGLCLIDEQSAKIWNPPGCSVYTTPKMYFEEANARAAFLICERWGVSKQEFIHAHACFKKAPHRMESLGVIGGIHWINDSKGTNVDAVTQAIKSIQTPIILIAGGKDKGGSYLPWLEEMENKVREICLFGEAAGKIAKELNVLKHNIHIFETLKEALVYANQVVHSGETVLFSPGCSSFDQYCDYKARGEHFVSLVHELRGEKR